MEKIRVEHIKKQDPEVYKALCSELERERTGLVMIPSENFASPAVLEAAGTVLTNKYSEGYPGKRYYSGNKYIDVIETLAIERAKKLFKAEHANVQVHSGSGANMACYEAVLKPGAKILGMDLAHGGHLTHGSKVNFSGRIYHFAAYGVEKDTERIDMDVVRKIAEKEKPDLVLSGHTAYPRAVDFDEFAEIAKDIGAYAMADISHIVGLCLAGVEQNPVPTNDIVMTTTTKTLRGPRSAVILCKKEDRLKEKYHPGEKRNLAQLIDFHVFPGLQGGPMEHIIAAKAVAFAEAMKPEFLPYQKQIQKNARALASALMEHGIKLLTDGTDNHLVLINCLPLKITGKQGANALEEAGIYANRNMIPFDPAKPFNPSGIRIGTPALTTRGMKEKEMKQIGEWVARILKDVNNKQLIEKIKKEVLELTKQFPLYSTLEY